MSTITTIPVASLNRAARKPGGPWRVTDVEALFALPVMDLIHQAQGVHRQHFDPNEIQLSTLLSIKTGGCAEDCGYCPQSSKFETGMTASKLMPVDAVVAAAQTAKAQGATRFCMGAAWRSPKPRDMEAVTEMVREVRALGLETCIFRSYSDELRWMTFLAL